MENKNEIRPQRWFLLILAAFVALATFYSLVIPLGEAADEVSHWAYIEYLRDNNRMPPPEGEAIGEAHQPPLYYILGALATSWVPRQGFLVIANPDFALDNPETPNLLLHPRREAFPFHNEALAWYLIRLLSTAMGAVTVWGTWQIAQKVFPGDDWIAVATSAFVAFLPAFISLAAVVNNDNLIIMLSTLSVLQLLGMKARTFRKIDSIKLGLLLGLGLLTKISALAIFLWVAIEYAYLTKRTGEWKNGIINFAFCFVTAGIITSPWIIYNWQNFGDPLGWSFYRAVGTLRETPMTLQDWQVIGPQLLTSFWGRFGGALQIHLPNYLYIILTLGTLMAVMGWLQFARDARKKKLDGNVREFFLLFTLFWIILVAAYLQWAIYDDGAGQARRLFPGLPPLALFLVAGWAR